MSDDKNSWRQFLDFHMRKNEGNNNNDSENIGSGTRASGSSSSEIIFNHHQYQQQQQQQARSAENQNGGSYNSNSSATTAGSSNSRERLKEAFAAAEDGYGRLFHGPDWEQQSLELLQDSYQNDPSGIRLVGGSSSDIPSSSTSSSQVHLKSGQSSTENLMARGSGGNCDTSYYFDPYDNSHHHHYQHLDDTHDHQEGSSRCINLSGHCRHQSLNDTFPNATMKLGVDSESDEDSLDLYLEYYRQSGGKDQEQENKESRQQVSPRTQSTQNSRLAEELCMPSSSSTQQQPGSPGGLGGHGGGVKMGILEMLEQLQALTRTRAAAAAAAASVRPDGSPNSSFSAIHNAMPFQSTVPHSTLGIYTTNENNLIVAQQYAEWEKEMDLAEDAAFNMDFYFDHGEMDGSSQRSDIGTSSRGLESLSLEDRGLSSVSEMAHQQQQQRRAASRFGLTTGLGQYRCDYSSLCPGSESSSADYNLIRVADNPRGFTPRSYFTAAGSGDSVAPPANRLESCSEKVEAVQDHGIEETGDVDVPEEQYIYDVEDGEATDNADVPNEIKTVTSSSSEEAGCCEGHGDTSHHSDSVGVNPFETSSIPPPSESGLSSRPRTVEPDEIRPTNSDRKLVTKVAGIRAGLRHFRRRISSCFVAQGD